MVDIRHAREIVGPDTVLVGNLDPVAEVQDGTPEEIAAKMVEVYRAAGNPFLAGAGCEIPKDTPVENLKALCRPIKFA